MLSCWRTASTELTCPVRYLVIVHVKHPEALWHCMTLSFFSDLGVLYSMYKEYIKPQFQDTSEK